MTAFKRLRREYEELNEVATSASRMFHQANHDNDRNPIPAYGRDTGGMRGMRVGYFRLHDDIILNVVTVALDGSNHCYCIPSRALYDYIITNIS
jgi:hypothetical protein